MDSLKNEIKKIGFINKLRAEKWKKHTRAELFTAKEIELLENSPEKISEAITRRLEALPDRGKNKLADLEKVYNCSPMSKRPDVDEKALKEDMLFWHFAYGFTFNEYACYQFIDKDYVERRTFLSDRDSAWLCYDMNDMRQMRILADKALTYERFKQYYGREAIVISDESDFERFLSFIERHDRFVKKNTRESCGRSVELIELASVTVTPQELFDTLIFQGRIILEEVITQSAEICAFNPSSVNTLRCITIRTKNEIAAPFFFFKTGRAGMFVDNGAAGGIIVAVDGSTGVLGTATDEYGNRFDAHPDSGIPFSGFQLPDWRQLVDMCCEMSAKLPEIRIIGWDLAHTDQGWIAIEGNSMTESIGPQSTWLRGMRKTVEELRLAK